MSELKTDKQMFIQLSKQIDVFIDDISSLGNPLTRKGNVYMDTLFDKLNQIDREIHKEFINIEVSKNE